MANIKKCTHPHASTQNDGFWLEMDHREDQNNQWKSELKFELNQTSPSSFLFPRAFYYFSGCYKLLLKTLTRTSLEKELLS